MAEYLKYLLEPLNVRGHVYRNRITTAPALMGIAMTPDGVVISTDWLKDKVRHARGGVGAVCIGETDIDPVWGDRWNIRAQDLSDPFMRAVSYSYTDFTKLDGPQMNSWRNIAREVHNAGALILDQLAHPGNMRVGLGAVKDRPVAVGPMSFVRANGEIVKGADEEDMQQICDSFAQAAVYMKTAGFDGVQIHGAHGWLLAQFLSERCNKRDDEYGGSEEKRCRFPVRVIKAVREAVGDDFIIEIRLSGQETGVPEGYGVSQVVTFAQMVDGIADIISVSNGHYNLHYSSHSDGGQQYDPHFININDAWEIKRNTKNMLLNIVGGINSPEEANRYIGEGKIDLIALGRQEFYADVDFANKCLSGHQDDIQRCVRCFFCAHGGNVTDKEDDWTVTAPPLPFGFQLPGKPAPKVGALCTVNPERGLDPPEGGWPAVQAGRKVLVAGGGVGGMMTAITAADRCHQVTIIEKDDHLGGVIGFTDHDPFKVDYKNYKDLLIRRVKNRGVNVRLNTEITEELIREEKPDVIVAAVGGTPRALPVPGAENAIHALDTYKEGFAAAGNVIVIGGGSHAAETGVYLSALPGVKNVTVLRANLDGVAEARVVNIVRRKMIEDGIGLIEDEKLLRLEPGRVITDQGVHEADLIVYHLGMEARKDTVERIRSAAGNIPVVLVGDCKAPRVVANAIREGYVEAMKII